MSREHRILPQAGFAAVRQALLDARPGDTVLLAAGAYVLDGTLQIPDGVTLAGDGRDATILAHDFDGPAVEARHVSGIGLRDLSIRSTVQRVAFRRLPEDDPIAEADIGERMTHWGLVFFDRCSGVAVQDLALSGNPDAKWLRGLFAHGCSGFALQAIGVESFGWSGINLCSTVDWRKVRVHQIKMAEFRWRKRLNFGFRRTHDLLCFWNNSSSPPFLHINDRLPDRKAARDRQ